MKKKILLGLMLIVTMLLVESAMGHVLGVMTPYDDIVLDTTAPSINNITKTGNNPVVINATIQDLPGVSGAAVSGLNESQTKFMITNSNVTPNADDARWQTSNEFIPTIFGDAYVWIKAVDYVGNTNIQGQQIHIDYEYTVNYYNEGALVDTIVYVKGDKTPLALASELHLEKATYSFDGWATSNGGAKVYEDGECIDDDINELGKVVNLYAVWAQNILNFANQSFTLEYHPTLNQTITIVGASDGSGTYSYSEEAEHKDGVSTSYVSISGTTITVVANAPAGEYSYKVKATDDNTTVTKTAIMTITVTPRSVGTGAGEYPATITLSEGNSFEYDGTNHEPTPIVVVDGKTLTENTDYTVTYPDDTKNVGEKTITITFKGNYEGEESIIYNVTKRAITITPNELSKVYGAVDPTLTYVVSGSGLVSGETLGGALTRESGENVGTYAISQGTLGTTDNGTYLKDNYNITFVTGNLFSITAKQVGTDPGKYPATITLSEGDSFEYDGTNHEPTPVVVVDDETLTEETDYEVTYPDDTKNAGDKIITITFKGNYEGEETITFTVTKRAITITPNELSKEYGKADPTLTYVVSGRGLVSGERLGGSLVREPGEDAGTYAIARGTLGMADNGTFLKDNYAITFTNGKVFRITAKKVGNDDEEYPATITLSEGNSFEYDGTNHEPTPIVVVDGKTLTENTDYTVTYPDDTKNVGEKTITITFKGNYEGEETITFTVTKRTITITPNELSKEYGKADPTLTFVVGGSGLVSGERMDGSLARESGENVGKYNILQDTLGIENNSPYLKDNYQITFVSGKKFTITAKKVGTGTNEYPATITLSEGNSFEYDGTNHKPTPTVVVDGKTLIPNTDYKVTYDTDTKNVGEKTITISFQGNYDGTATINYEVTKRTLTVTPNSLTKELGEADPVLTYTYTGNVDGETPRFTGSLTRASGDEVGKYAISKGTLDIIDNSPFLKNNYNLVVSTGVEFEIKRTIVAPDAPSIKVVNTSGQVITSGNWSNLELRISISSESENTGYKYSYDGITWYDYTGTIEYATNTASTTIYAKAYNTSDTTLESGVVSFEIKLDTVPPTSGSITLNGEQDVDSGKLKVKVTGCDDVTSGIARYVWEYKATTDSTFIQGVTDATSLGESEFEFPANAEKQYVVRLTIYDNAGNKVVVYDADNIFELTHTVPQMNPTIRFTDTDKVKNDENGHRIETNIIIKATAELVEIVIDGNKIDLTGITPTIADTDDGEVYTYTTDDYVITRKKVGDEYVYEIPFTITQNGIYTVTCEDENGRKAKEDLVINVFKEIDISYVVEDKDGYKEVIFTSNTPVKVVTADVKKGTEDAGEYIDRMSGDDGQYSIVNRLKVEDDDYVDGLFEVDFVFEDRFLNESDIVTVSIDSSEITSGGRYVRTVDKTWAYSSDDQKFVNFSTMDIEASYILSQEMENKIATQNSKVISYYGVSSGQTDLFLSRSRDVGAALYLMNAESVTTLDRIKNGSGPLSGNPSQQIGTYGLQDVGSRTEYQAAYIGEVGSNSLTKADLKYKDVISDASATTLRLYKGVDISGVSSVGFVTRTGSGYNLADTGAINNGTFRVTLINK